MKDININLDINKVMRETKVRVKIKGMAIYRWRMFFALIFIKIGIRILGAEPEIEEVQ